MHDVADPTRKQPGNVSFGVFRSQDETTVLIGFERWASGAAHDQHLNGAHVRKLLETVTPLLAEPPTISSYSILDE